MATIGLKAQDGSPDLSFANNGTLQTDHNFLVSSMEIQPDGKILALGTIFNFTNDTMVIVRYNQDGSLDTDFGIDGRVDRYVNSFTSYNDLIVLSNGDIMISGSIFQNAFLAKMDSSGNFKSDFGEDGVKKNLGINSDYQAAIMHLTEDEEIYLLHGHTNNNGSAAPAISKWTTDGERITNFGTNGELKIDISFGTGVSAIETDENKNVYALYSGGSLIKMDENGIIDNDFAGTGYILFGPGQTLTESYTGVKSVGDKLFLFGGKENNYHIWKITDQGIGDSTFGNNGVLSGQWEGSTSFCTNIMLLEDDSFLAGGLIINNSDRDLSFAKYDESGNIDNSFANNGVIKTSFGGATLGNLYGSNKLGTIMMGGRNRTTDDLSFRISRYNFEQTLGIEDAESLKPIVAIYPNPTTDRLNIDFKNHSLVAYELIDHHGKTIRSKRNLTLDNSFSLSLIGLDAGNYFLNLKFEDGFSRTHQLIKLK